VPRLSPGQLLSCLPPLPIALLNIDFAARSILHGFNPGSFIAAKAMPIPAALRFITGNLPLLPPKTQGLMPCQASILKAVRNAVLLMNLPLIDAGMRIGGGRKDKGSARGGKGNQITHDLSPIGTGVFQDDKRASNQNPSRKIAKRYDAFAPSSSATAAALFLPVIRMPIIAIS
jgi:hypothetical protein